MMNSKLDRTSIVHHTGKKMVMLGGNCHRKFQKGDLIVELKWVDGEPVMIIYKYVLGANSPAFMIEMQDAYQFAQSNGNATKKLVCELAAQAATAIGSDNDKATAFRIIDAIMNFMPELLMMPPEPKELEIANRPSTGNDELSIKVNGQTIVETAV